MSETPGFGRSAHRLGLVEAQPNESIGQRETGCLGRVFVAPHSASEPPTDLDCRREVRIEGGGPQTDVAGERSGAPDLDGPEPESLRFEVVVDALREYVRL